ncbi:MAG TPA: 23S rRNA (adenine(2030)-N(6))-methyltransferase RlmJ [Pseudomonadaceae bacterium]|nr:23S rRNA (adenine(2030)-N(6))-methyltransferase RlmJ [Pseudomonadaceae bacterium]
MLSYRHAFHAGNIADILKHLVLVNTLHHATRKASPLFYLDTHAGAGLYNLQSVQAAKTGEAEAGILGLDFPALQAACDEAGRQALGLYAEAVQPFLAKQQYPGSPLLAASILRRSDHLHLFELHPSDYALLVGHTQRHRNIRCERLDGYRHAPGLIPPVQKRAVVLIDPSYELDSEGRAAAKLCATIHQRLPGAQILLWYPVVSRREAEQLAANLVRREIRDLWRFELGSKADTLGSGMTASGMLVVNPPWTLPAQLENCLPLLQEQLAKGWGNWKVERLTAE